MLKTILTIAMLTSFAVVTAAAEPRPGGSVVPTFKHVIPNIPGKSLVAVTVTYPPRGVSPAHTHARSAFIFAYVLDGEVRSSVDGAPAKIYRKGDSWYEPPQAHHGISENASESQPAHLLAVFVVDSADRVLTTPDK